VAEGRCFDHGSNMLLSTEGRGEPLFDISRSPLFDFHYQERHHQGKLAKVCYL
jgi:hypothetical protein